MTAVEMAALGKSRGGRKWWRAMAQPCEEWKIGALAPILPNLAGRPRSAIGYGVLEREVRRRVLTDEISRRAACKEYLFEPVHYLALLERKPGGFDHARPLENWQLPDCFALLRRRLEAKHGGLGTRELIRVLRLLEKFSLQQWTEAVEYALDFDVIDPESIRLIVTHRADSPLELFKLDGRPHLAWVRVETTQVSSSQALLTEATS